jgi:hypothetical protein
MRTTLARSAALAFGLLLASVSPALAVSTDIGTISFQMEVTDELGGLLGTWSPASVAITQDPLDDDVYTVGDGAWSNANYGIEWDDVSFDVDPGVSGNWAVTNNSLVAQIFTLSVTVPVLPVAPSSLMFGSSTISVSDANFDGSASLASVAGLPVYVGEIDLVGVPATALFAAPYLLSAPPGGTIGDTESFGVFPGSVPGPGVSSTIGITHRFLLSAGDRATFNSTFFLVAIPEPGTLALAAAGMAGLGLVGRRRS